MVKTIRRSIFIILVLGVLAILMSSCQWMSEEYDDEIADSSAAQYINITVSVSASNNPVTRANPRGGEYGDGPEKGLDRENEVSSITLIFYQDGGGINLTTNPDAKVIDVKTYAVRPIDETGTHTHKTGEPTEFQNLEVLYTTGDQKLEETALEVGQTYKVLVVANATIDVSRGDKISDVRDKVLASVYTGTGVAVDATQFVMASETDAEIRLTEGVFYPSIATTQKDRYVYYFDCIHIERLSARIDFWAKNGTYDATTYNHAGYVYDVSSSGDGDKFVLTSITPFNLLDGNEYLFKRTNDTSSPYLADETLLNWVYDPYTTGKTASSHPDYMKSKLDDVVTTFANDYNVTMTGQQANKLTVSGSDDIIIGYPKENTLASGKSYLYYYATGLAFEGYYYKKGSTTSDDRRLFYHYLRHQGEKDEAYDAIKGSDALDKTAVCPVPSTDVPAMNYGIVRNNIYRVSIESITPDEDGLFVKLLIKVKKWDKFVHIPIYM